MSLESKAKTTLEVAQIWTKDKWVPLEEAQKLEQTCKGLAKELHETIDSAADTIRDYQILLKEVNENCKYKKRVEAAKQILADNETDGELILPVLGVAEPFNVSKTKEQEAIEEAYAKGYYDMREGAVKAINELKERLKASLSQENTSKENP